MKLEDLSQKISNNGATPQGKLTSEEYNVLLLAVKAHDSLLKDLLAVENITLEDVEAYLAENSYITRDALAPYATSNSVSALLGNYLPLSSFTKATIKSTLGISDWALEANDYPYVRSRGYTNLSKIDTHTNGVWYGGDLSVIEGVSRYGILMSLSPNNATSHIAQIYMPEYSGRIAYRSKYNKTDWSSSSWNILANLSDVPTKLSQLTDDVVAGKYLSLRGGRLVYSGAQGLEAERTDGAPTHIMFRGVVNGTSRQLGGFGMNGYNDPVYVNPNGIRHKVLTSENYATYALPKDGTAAAATKLATPHTIWGQSFDGTEDVDGDLTLNGGILSYTNGVWTLNGDLLVTGGVTQFAQGVKTASSIMDAIVVDDETITKRDGKLVAIGGSGEVATVSLGASSLSVGSTFYISEAQFNAILKSRKGIAVVIQDVNNAISDSEWGQVISCYRQYAGSSVYTYRVSILHKDNAPWSGADNAKLYNVDIMDSPSSSGYNCIVTSINNLY